MEISTPDEGVAANDFDQWMDWNGRADSLSLTQDVDVEPASLSNSRQPYPVSPSTTANSDLPSQSSHSKIEVHAFPTPSHSSNSPEVPVLLDFRLSGDTLREASPVRSTRPILKRKLSPNDAISYVSKLEESTQPGKKRPHNVIEKRYRANLNEKITELRDSVPSLRASKKVGRQTEVASDNENEDLDGPATSTKLNKASILTKAVEYIRHLELRNKKLVDENLALKERLRTLDKVLASAGDSSTQRASAFTSETAVETSICAVVDDGSEEKTPRKPHHPPQGLIPVPANMRRLRAEQPQEHYGAIYESAQGHKGGSKWPTRFMLGSLAGLMIMEGFGEGDQGSESKEKGLFGIPLELLDGYAFLRSPRIYLAAFAQYCRGGGAFPLIKGFMALSILAFFVFAYLFNSKPSPPPKEAEPVKPQRAPSLASPIDVRRQAWLTSMQILQLPHHDFFPEWLAVTNEWFKYTIKLILGESMYRWVTGYSGEDELARTKAWDIAIDAQLAGGDPEISRSRLVLTIVGSGLLPRSPSRLMLKALHCRVLLWKVGCRGGFVSRVANRVAISLAERQWKTARQLHSELPLHHSDALPAHLTRLLDRDCDEILLDSVVQPACNLMYGRATSEDAGTKMALMDVVVEDHAIRSPLDAVAAWWSCQVLLKALACSLNSDVADQGAFHSHLQSAILIAPPGSAAHTRALAVHSTFNEQNRFEFHQRVIFALPKSKKHQNMLQAASQVPHFIDSSTPESAVPEILSIIHCIMSMELLDRVSLDLKSQEEIERAIDLFSLMPIDLQNMTLLSFAPAYRVLQKIRQSGSLCDPVEYEQTLQKLSKWAQINVAYSPALLEQVVANLENICSELKDHRYTRRQSNVSNDTGYSSLGEGEAV